VRLIPDVRRVAAPAKLVHRGMVAGVHCRPVVVVERLAGLMAQPGGDTAGIETWCVECILAGWPPGRDAGLKTNVVACGDA
jgi:hypothetical protein